MNCSTKDNCFSHKSFLLVRLNTNQYNLGVSEKSEEGEKNNALIIIICSPCKAPVNDQGAGLELFNNFN